MSSTNYINGTIIPRALETFGKAAIRRTGDGGIIGAPLLSNDECNRPKGELRLDDIENMLNAFALNSHINKDSKYDDDFFLVMDHAIDQGFAFGHGTDAHRHLLNKGRDFLFSHDPYTGLRTGYFQRFF